MMFFCLAPAAYGGKGVFTPAIGIGAEYSDNIYLTHDDKVSDTVLYASPQVTWDLSGERNSLILFFSPTFRNYVKGSEENVTHYNASLSSAIPVSKDTVFELTDTFLLSDDPVEDLEDRSIRKTRAIYHRNTTQMGVKSQFGPFESTYVQCAYSVLRNDDPSVQDSDEFTPSAGLTLRFLSQWLLSIDGSYTLGEFFSLPDEERSSGTEDFDEIKTSVKLSRRMTDYIDFFARYSQSFMRYKGLMEDYDVMEPALGISVKMDEAPLFSIQVGYYLMKRYGAEDEGGLTVSGDLGRSFRFKKGSFRLSGSSGYDESYFGAENLGFSIYHQGSADIAYALTQKVTYELNTQVRSDRYKNLGYKRIDTKCQVATGVRYSLREWVSIRLSYEYTNVDVNAAHIRNQETDWDYEENRLVLEAFFSPAAPDEED